MGAGEIIVAISVAILTGAVGQSLVKLLIDTFTGREGKKRTELDRAWRERDKAHKRRRVAEEYAHILRKKLIEAPCVDEDEIPPWPVTGDTGEVDTVKKTD